MFIPARFTPAILAALLAVTPAEAQVRTRPIDPVGVAAARQGWKAIDAGEAQAALDQFVKAIERDADVATYRLGAGLALHQLGRSDEARAHLEEAVRLDPGLTPASVLLGLVLHRAGQLDAAIRVYEHALEHAPGDPQIVPRLDAWRQEASLQGSFQQSMSTNFTVLFEGPAEQQLAARALELLEAAYWRIGGALGIYPAEVITVVLYTGQQFSDVTRSPRWAAGLYDGRIKVPMLGALDHPDELERVLAHELTHAFVHALAARGVPQWLNEGLAGVFERPDLSWAQAIVREAPSLVPLDRLHGDFSGLSPAGARLAYAESALAARYLLDQSGPSPLVALLTDLGGNVGFAESFNQRILIPYETFAANWAAQAR